MGDFTGATDLNLYIHQGRMAGKQRAAQRVGSRMRQSEGDDGVMREGREHRVQWENLSDLNDVYGIIHPQQFDDKLDMGALHS